MKPLFTVHVGEYLVGSYIEQHYKRVSVWIPSRDTGVDLMVSDRRGRSTVSIQVKFSKDFLPTHVAPEFREPLRVCTFFLINRDKLRASHVRARQTQTDRLPNGPSLRRGRPRFQLAAARVPTKFRNPPIQVVTKHRMRDRSR